MSIKTTLTNPPTIALIALQIIGGLLILASIMGFKSGGMLWPMLGSGAGTSDDRLIPLMMAATGASGRAGDRVKAGPEGRSSSHPAF